jgi:hypothetical protein
MSRTSTKPLLNLVWIVALYAGLLHVTRHTWRYAVRDYKLMDTPPLGRMNTQFINLLTLGHRGLYDDFATIWSLQALMDMRLADVPPEEVQRAILAVTRHGPQIESLYSLTCYILAFDFKRPDLCERITVDGIKALPDSWRIPMIQGYLYYGPLQNTPNAALYYGLAASKEDCPPFLKKLASNLVQKNSLDPEDLDALARELLPKGSLRGRFGDLLKRGENPPQPDKW